MYRIFIFFLTFLIPIISLADQLIIEPDNGRTPIINAIQNAKTSVDLVMYGLTDQELIKTLIAAKNQGKKVTVLLEPKPYESEGENALAIALLENADIPVEKPNPAFQLTHQKTLIIDKNKAYILTFNFTRSSFTNQRNFGIEITDPNQIQEIENVMHADSAHQNPSLTQTDLVWSPNNSREKLIHLIESAKSKIEIYAQDVTDYQVIGALAKAAKKGIHIHILTNDKNTKNKNKYDYLTRAGVEIDSSKNYYIHAKVMIIDDKTLLLGSMNLTQPSIESNRELSLVSNNAEIIQKIQQTFTKDSGN